MGSQLAYDFAVPNVGVLTVGGEVNADIRALQQVYLVTPEPTGILNSDHPDVTYGFFAQQQWRLSPAWNAYLGVRFDDSKDVYAFSFHRAWPWSTRLRRSPATSFFSAALFATPALTKRITAMAFIQMGNAALGPEQADTFEVAAEHRFSPKLSGLVSAYHYQISGLITDVVTADGLAQYQNLEQARSNGVETELSGRLREHVDVTASVAVQRTTEAHGQTLTNSPECVGKLRGSIPLARNKMRAAMAIQYLSTREVIGSGLVPSYWLSRRDSHHDACPPGLRRAVRRPQPVQPKLLRPSQRRSVPGRDSPGWPVDVRETDLAGQGIT